jgi:multidrug efflux pump subunit AcrA (membrane-fusion protein)
LGGRVAQVSTAPVEDGKFGAEFTVGAAGSPDWVVPGMTCSVIVTTYQRADAVTVPAKAVRTDEADPTSKYVYVLGEDDKKPRRQPVRVGKKSGDEVEILEGVDAGDHVALGDVEE